MSEVTVKDREVSQVIHVRSGAKGELTSFTRVTTRGKGNKKAIKITYEALFRLEDVLGLQAGDTSEIGKYFMKELGTCNVVNLNEVCSVSSDRDRWIFDNFVNQ